MTFIAWFNSKFWITNKKMLIKKSLLVMFISSFLQLWTTNKSKNFQKSKKSLLVTFIAWFKSGQPCMYHIFNANGLKFRPFALYRAHYIWQCNVSFIHIYIALDRILKQTASNYFCVGLSDNILRIYDSNVYLLLKLIICIWHVKLVL